MTAQIKDNCMYLGCEYQMPVLLSIPVHHTNIEERSLSELESVDSSALYLSTACWRNYVATWEIKDSRLYLVNLEGKYRLVGDDALFASWFTGEFELPQGELVECIIEPEFKLKYTKSATLTFESGVLIKSYVRKVE